MMRFDDAEVSGVFGIDGYIDLANRSAEDAVTLILQRVLPRKEARQEIPEEEKG